MAKSAPITADFLDSEQYTHAAIEAYESVYGRDYVSPGGAAMARELISNLALQPDARVLDVGCGLGGSAFLMAREFGLRVDGIDLSHNMLAMARNRRDAYGLRGRVSFEHGDCLTLRRPGRYDAVYSRDVFLHIRDKAKLFEVLLDSLRPGGQLLFTDYCCGPGPWREEFSEYVQSRGYALHMLPEYVAFLETAGFVAVEARDWSHRFAECLQVELGRIRASVVEDDTRAKLESGWLAKLARVAAGDHRWGMITASRSTQAGG
ncbi:MAG: methyltransferase domain-containing protein [Gammaproteobacteria bacterium]|nr:methyltransferase domain-containing protein [Gammaproteobacteria bacterium]